MTPARSGPAFAASAVLALPHALDALPARFEAVLHTPTVALYRYRTRPAR